MKPRRALLFMPGDDRHKIEKGAALGVDAIIMDLEDGVALSRKQAARETIAAALQAVDFGQTERLIRINPPVGGGLYVADLEATAPYRPDGYVLPKVESAQQLRDVSQRLEQFESRFRWPEGTIKLLALIETARGVVNLREIAESDDRLVALIFGAEDLAADLGAIRTPDGWEVFYGRSAVVIHARANGIQPIDTIYPHLQNRTGLESETEQALYMGFTGKLAIHPQQVEVIQAVFTPSAEDVARAQHMIAAFRTHQAAGEGVFVFDGKMIDMPMIRAAEVVLARARTAGTLDV
ncbi:MAG: CoA ester lyase [Anaerolineae bacterium]|nr:CoA ester lyase [Anaerolineae bacterium]